MRFGLKISQNEVSDDFWFFSALITSSQSGYWFTDSQGLYNNTFCGRNVYNDRVGLSLA